MLKTFVVGGRVLLAATLVLFTAAQAYAASIGRFQFVIGDVVVTDASGRTRPVAKGDELNEGDTIGTAALASAQLRMIDGAFVAVRPDSKLKFDQYRYSGKEDGTERGVISLLVGGLRTVTGVIGRTNHANYSINTPTATIGIRGTDHETVHIPAPGENGEAIKPIGGNWPLPSVMLGQAVSAEDLRDAVRLAQAYATQTDVDMPFLLALEGPAGKPAFTPPPGLSGPPGTYNKVNTGLTSLTTLAGTTLIQPNQVGYAASRTAPVVILPKVPEFFKASGKPGQPRQQQARQGEGQGQQQGQQSSGGDTTGGTSTGGGSSAGADSAASIVTAPVTSSPAPAPPTTTTPPPVSVPPIVQPPLPPAVPVLVKPATGSTFSHAAVSLQPATGGGLYSFSGYTTANKNTDYVLDGSNNLTEIRRSTYFCCFPASSLFFSDANIKFTGGAGKDQFSDPSGIFFLGRWEGGQIAVTDNLGVTSAYTQPLGATSAHWGFGATPGNSTFSNTLGPINNVQMATGTASYSLLAATRPTDAFGNVGTLNSASLTANFNAQTVNTALSLSFSNKSISVSSNNNPIFGTGFFVNPSSTTVSCTGAGCVAPTYIPDISGQFGSSAAGGSITGAVGSLAGIYYSLYTVSGNIETDDILGVALFGAASAPTQGFFPTNLTGGTGKYRHQFIFPASTSSNGYAINQYSTTNNGVPVTIGASATGNAGTFLVRGNRPFDPVTEDNTNLLLDSSGNLVRVNLTQYRVQDRGNNVTATQNGLAIPSASAMVSITGATVEANAASPSGFPAGVTVGGSYNDSANNILLGRYQGGTVVVVDPFASSTTSLIDLGSRSAYWAIRETPPAIPISGNFMYTPVYATRPSDSLGNLGTLNYASLNVHFGTMTVDPAVSVTVNNQTLTASGSNIPIAGTLFGFNQRTGQSNQTGNVLRIGNDSNSCFGTNCATNSPNSPNLQFGCTATGACGNPYSASITGGFGGANGQAGGAFFSYEFETNYNPGDTQAGTRPTNDYITGSVAFTKGAEVMSQSLTTGLAGNNVLVAYSAKTTCGASPCIVNSSSDYQVASANPFGGAAPITITDSFFENQHSLTLSSGTPASATTGTATGITLGRYTGATVGADNNFNGLSPVFPATVLGSFNWASVPGNAFPAAILNGSATYTFDKGFAFNQSNIAGTFSTPPTLTANFYTQSVSVGLNIAVPANATGGSNAATWVATANNIKLGDIPASFQAYAGCSTCLQSKMTVTLNGSSSGTNGNLRGALGTVGLSGAGLTFAFSGQDAGNSFHPEQISGAAAFALTSFATTPNGTTVTGTGTVAAPFAINGNNFEYAMGMGVSGLNSGASTVGLSTSSNNSLDLLAGVHPGIDSYGRVSFDSNGNPIRWDGQANMLAGTGTCSPSPCTPQVFTNNVNATFSIRPQDFTGVLAGQTPATILDAGRDPQTGITWGRYAAGNIAVFSRIGGAFAPTTNDVSVQNFHLISSGLQTGAVLLPISGTFNYAFAGGTKPTDNLGNIGTLTAQSLTANFTAQTVSASITANFTAPSNTGTWVATTGTAANTFIPIQQGVFFHGQTGNTGSNLTATVNGSATGVTGQLTGLFAGKSGQGAMVGYSINKGGTVGTSTLGTTVSGVAAFKR